MAKVGEMARDYYQVLEVRRGAGDKEIKTAYRRLARKYHPDVNPGDPAAAERFKEVSVAYSVLSDPKKRRSYDLFGQAPRGSSSSSGADPFAGFSDFGDMFSELFGKRRGPPRPEPGVDVEITHRISLQEAVQGVEADITVVVDRQCPDCQGRGSSASGQAAVCPECGGEGVRKARGPVPFSRSCPRCNGTGRQPGANCSACQGQGLRPQTQKLKVQIPPGVSQGSRVRLRGKGTSGRHQGPAGDLYIVVNVQDDPVFRREDDDLYTRIQIPFQQAILGTKVEVPTTDGSVTMAIPAGTQGGQKFRLRGKGAPRLKGSGNGDLLVEVHLEVPVDLDSSAKDLLDAFVLATASAVASKPNA